MKREIRCLSCKPRVADKILCDKSNEETIDHSFGEHIKAIKGKAIVECRCDMCDKKINVGDDCLAVTMWSDKVGIPYHWWEHEYIDDGES